MPGPSPKSGTLSKSQWGRHLRQRSKSLGRAGGGYGEGENGLQLASLEERAKAEATIDGTET